MRRKTISLTERTCAPSHRRQCPASRQPVSRHSETGLTGRCFERYEVFMKITALLNEAIKPPLYTKGSADMWQDEYISRQLLDVHCSPDTDLASRKPATIRQTIDWIFRILPGERLDIRDLGYGPGLYTEKMAALGHRVTGILTIP